MVNGEIKRMVDGNGQPSNRFTIQVDDIGHVIDIPAGLTMDEVVAEFWVQYRAKKARDQKIIAANTLKRRQEAEAARQAVAASVAHISDAELEELAVPVPETGLKFEGLEADTLAPPPAALAG